MTHLPRVLLFTLIGFAAACSSERRIDVAPTGTPRDAGAQADGGVVVQPTPCQTGADCAQGVCDRIRGACVECRATSDCPIDSICDDGVCASATPCQSDLECTSAGLVCDRGAGRCAACNSAAECNELPCIGGSCVATRACDSSLDCTDLNMVCGDALPPAWPESFAGGGCVECVRNEDCPAQSACTDGLCVDVCAGTGRVCGSVQGVSCGTCPGGAVCSSAGIVCIEGPVAEFGPADLAVAVGGTVYVARDGRASGAATVWAVDLASSSTRIAYRDFDGDYLDGLAVAGGQVYAALTSGMLLRGPADGLLTAWRDVPRQVGGAGPSSSSVWCQALAGHADSLVCNLVDYDSIVTTGLYRVPLDGSPASLFEDQLFQTDGLVVVGDEVVWSPVNGRFVAKSNVRTGARQELVSTQGFVVGVAGGYAYYRANGGGYFRVPVAGGAPESLSDVTVVAASESGVFAWTAGRSELVELGPDGRVAKVLLDTGPFASELDGLRTVHRFGGDVYLVGANGILRLLQ